MDRVIYKYAIEPGPARDEVGELDGAVVLAGPDNRGIPCVWIEGDPDAPRRDRTFALVGTGGLIPEGYEHRGSFFDLPYVWHVYEKVS